jgi:hypothetical protein
VHKNCTACYAQIDARAVKCATCGSMQNWQRFLPVSGTVLSSLVALFAVLTVLIPVIVQLAPKHPAPPTLAVIRMDETGLVVSIGNSGPTPLIFVSGGAYTATGYSSPDSVPIFYLFPRDRAATDGPVIKAGEFSIVHLAPVRGSDRIFTQEMAMAKSVGAKGGTCVIVVAAKDVSDRMVFGRTSLNCSQLPMQEFSAEYSPEPRMVQPALAPGNEKPTERDLKPRTASLADLWKRDAGKPPPKLPK